MKERIETKMKEHVESILEKTAISNDEYMLLGAHLMRLETKEKEENALAHNKDFTKRLKDLSLLVFDEQDTM